METVKAFFESRLIRKEGRCVHSMTVMRLWRQYPGNEKITSAMFAALRIELGYVISDRQYIDLMKKPNEKPVEHQVQDILEEVLGIPVDYK